MVRSPTVTQVAPVFERSQIAQVARLGCVEYAVANQWQIQRARQVTLGSRPEIVALLEHPPTYTQGRRGGREHLLVPELDLGAPLIDTDRGGDLTFHGPGQLIVWPILRIRERGVGIAQYVRLLEQSVIAAVASFGVVGGRVRGRPGVWVSDRKLASVGVRVQAGVSRHGLALNVSTDLRWFDAITACGIVGAETTSLVGETRRELTVPEVMPRLEQAIEHAFGLRLAPVEIDLNQP